MRTGAKEGFVWVDNGSITVISGYFSPNRPIQEFEEYISQLEDRVTAAQGRLVIAGDLNAKSALWGACTTDGRGRLLEGLVATHNLLVGNEGEEWTYSRGGVGSAIDITLYRRGGHVTDWRLLEEDSLSDHRQIAFIISTATGGVELAAEDQHLRGTRRWLEKQCRPEQLSEFLATTALEIKEPNEMAADLDSILRRACDSSMPRVSGKPGRKEVHWWNANIASLRRAATYARRRVERTRRRGGAEQIAALEVLRGARVALRNCIRKSKEEAWEQLCSEMDADPWGLPFRIVRGKVQNRGPPPEAIVEGGIDAIIGALFPRDDPIRLVRDQGMFDHPLVSAREIALATSSIKPNKAPGPDGIPSKAIAMCGQVNPDLLAGIFNRCLSVGSFPVAWKVAYLVLLPKPGKPLELPSAYRPICLLNIVGKVFERVLANRLETLIQPVENQYGFRKGMGTVGAVQRVLGEANRANTGLYKNRQFCVIATFDIRNAFNSLPWRTVFREFNRRELPEYLVAILRDYLNERGVIYGKGRDQTNHPVTAGVPQGSVLGPMLWNMAYDHLLAMRLPEGVTMVGFADDLAVVARNRDRVALQANLQEVVDLILDWLRRAGLALAAEKTQLTALSVKRGLGDLAIQVGAARISTGTSTRYLGVEISANRFHTPHIKGAVRSALAADKQLSRLMANVRGPGQRTRSMLYNSVVGARLLYAAPIWANGLRAKSNKEAFLRVQRLGAIRTIRAYRTISTEAASVLAGMIPVDLAAEERRVLDEERGDLEWTPVTKRERKARAREATLAAWQTRWEASPHAGWTRRLIPRIEGWLSRRHGELSYHLTQLLTGHGSFGSYLQRIGKAAHPGCFYCDHECDDAEHTMLHCGRWDDERSRLYNTQGMVAPQPGEVINAALADVAAWRALLDFAAVVMGTKEAEERGR